MVDYVLYGKGSFERLQEVIRPHRVGELPMVYLLDHFFEGDEAMIANIQALPQDRIIMADVTTEPKTSYVDQIADQLKSDFAGVSGIIGIGGGSTLDLAKAVAIMMTNQGKAQEYQGWDLVKKPAVWKAGVPTLAGTGAEVSRTCVLTGPEKKLGMNSDFTPFNQILLDPLLLRTVPADQRFYTGMDCYIHCIESLTGTYLNAFSKTYGEKALELCQRVFLGADSWDLSCDEDLMMASYFGGMSIAYSQVGVAHAVSYGLSYLLGVKHGIGNCIVFNHLEEFYPEGVAEFKQMVAKNNIEIPENLTRGLRQKVFDTMINVSLGMAPLWENALGPDWRSKMDANRLRGLFERL